MNLDYPFVENTLIFQKLGGPGPPLVRPLTYGPLTSDVDRCFSFFAGGGSKLLM